MIHLPQICLNFLIFPTVWVARKFCGKKGILEIVKGFLNKRLWKHCLEVQNFLEANSKISGIAEKGGGGFSPPIIFHTYVIFIK
jgi:hypothetical protein